MSQGTRRLAAIMFTDMVGYTALGQRNESLSLALVDEQRKLVRPILVRHGGREVKTIGDAFLVEFQSALDAVRCAYDVQRAVREFNFSMPEERKVHLRIGVHLGDVVESEGDISGDAVNVASRIEPLAEDGGVCVTRQVHDSVRGKIELQMESLGPRPLKNVGEPMEVFRMVMPWARGTAPDQTHERSRLAILPFRNMSPDPNDEYFAEGMTEEIISTVSKIRELTVISRTSVMRYRNLTVPVAQIGQELKVGSVLEGSIRKAGNKIRITAQLIDVQSDGHLWSQSYDKELADVFAIQGDIAEQIADSLKVQLLQGELMRIHGQATSDIGAYTLYLKGRHFWFERTEENTRKALQYFQEAVKLDPDFAMAYSGIADCYSVLSDYMWMDPREALSLAKANSMKALEADDSLAEAHASLALVLADYDWDLVAAEREYRKAIELKPNYAIAFHWLAVSLFHMRRYKESGELERRCLELDPYSRLYNMVSNNIVLIDGDAERAAERYEELVKMYPDFPALWYWKSVCHLVLSQYDLALKSAQKGVDLQANHWFSRLQLAWANAAAGNLAEAEKTVSEAVEASKTAFVGPATIGHVMLRLGKGDEGYAWLERAYSERDPQLLYFNGFPWTREYRKDPRYAAIEARFGFKSAPD